MPLPSVDCFRGLDQRDQLTALYEAAVQIGGGTPFDPDAEDFFIRAGITDDTQKNAVNQLVLDLKAASIWANLVALYPFVGGTANSHSFNLANAMYQITWDGTLTHSANGVQGDGATGYGNTNIDLQGAGVQDFSASGGCYLNIPDTAGAAQFGTPTSGAAVDVIQLFTNLSGTSYYFAAFGTNTGKIQGANGAGTSGFFVGSRTDANTITLYRNAVNVLSSGAAATEGGPPNLSMFIFSRDDSGSPDTFSDCRMALCFFAIGLSAADVTAFNTAVQAFETTLGRA